MRGVPEGPWVYLAVGATTGVVLAAVGAAPTPPFPGLREGLPAVWHDRLTLVGLGLVAASSLLAALLVALRTTVFLLSLVFTGREALERLPDVDPLVGGAVGVVVLGAVVMGGGALVTGGVGGTGTLPYVEEALGDGPPEAHGVVANDELEGFAATGESLPTYRDRLPDSWERAGETPDGVSLPDADPDHKDLYLQLNYANGHPPLNGSERADLRRIWATMAVSNPDGEPGIDLHVVDDPPLGRAVDDRVVLDESGFSAAFLETYYGTDYLGDRGCSHYLALFGDVQGRYAGWGSVPGYLSVVDGDEFGRTAGVSDRVRILTHELLHNVAGELDNGDSHVQRGWLAGVNGEFEPRLSGPTSRAVNRSGFERSAAFETRLCAEPVGASNDSAG